MKLISLIVPVLNEEEAIPLFYDAVQDVLHDEPYDVEILFIDDGSTDRTLEIIEGLHARDPRVRGISFSRNFGKELALAAGLQAARGDAVVPMDVDLQDPPALLKQFLRRWEQGYEMVIGVRARRDADSWAKRVSAGLFYRSAIVAYERPARVAGSSKWPGWKLWNFALDGITSFSTLPLRLWSYLGIVVALAGFAYAGFLVFRTLVRGVEVPGYASLMVVTLCLGGLILCSLGIVGEYLGRVFQEVKGRPQYVVRRRIGMDDRGKRQQGKNF